jgi:hypothetical protein
MLNLSWPGGILVGLVKAGISGLSTPWDKNQDKHVKRGRGYTKKREGHITIHLHPPENTSL